MQVGSLFHSTWHKNSGWVKDIPCLSRINCCMLFPKASDFPLGQVGMKAFDRFVPRLFEGVVWVLVLLFAAVWDALISPERNGIPLPILTGSLLVVLLVFSPFRFER